MQGDPEIIEILNEVLTAELTAINQYFLHSKMCENWGYMGLAEHHRKESLQEMRHGNDLIERILFLDGLPNIQNLEPVRIGETVPEQIEADLDLEMTAVRRLNDGIVLCRQKGDHGTGELLEGLLRDEEAAIDWLEGQISLLEEIGKENYLASQIRG